jgi:predicted RNase H-like HicB family nuclease
VARWIGYVNEKDKDLQEVFMRQVLLYPGEDGYWVAECPSLPGCISQGMTREKAIENIREAIDLYIESLTLDDLPVPNERFEALLVAV